MQPLAITSSDLPTGSESEEILARLVEHAHAARGAMSAESVRALRNDVRLFSGWCADRKLSPLPAEPSTVATFIDDMAETKAPASVRRYLASIAALHRAAAVPDPSRAETVRLAVKRMARSKGTRQRQAAPLNERHVQRILATAGNSPRELRDISVLLVCRDLLARRSEVVALTVNDIAFAEDGSATAMIARSKVDTEGQGATRWLSPRSVSWLRRWLVAADIRHGVLFRAVNKGGHPGAPLLPDEIAKIFKRLAARVGLDPEQISGHSARVGMSQDLLEAGAELSAIMQAGRWSTPAMPARYAERLLAGRGAVARFYRMNDAG